MNPQNDAYGLILNGVMFPALFLQDSTKASIDNQNVDAPVNGFMLFLFIVFLVSTRRC
jgi:hypothetical protein